MIRTTMDLVAELLRLLRSEEGQGLTEYALIFAVVLPGALLSLGLLALIVAGYLDDAAGAFP